MANELEIKYISLSEAIIWDRNEKRHDIGGLVTSIKRHGFKDAPKFEPSLNGGKGGIVEGNGRITALNMMKEDGEEIPRGIKLNGNDWLVPVAFGVDAHSEKAAEAYAIDHNNLTMAGGDFTGIEMAQMWNDGYTEILADLAMFDELPVSVTGDDLDDLISSNYGGDNQDVEPEIDRAEELRQEYSTELGQIWQLGDHRLICGDCTDKAVVDRLLFGVLPLLMVTDPPYGVNYDPNWRNDAAAKGYLSFSARRTGTVLNDDRIDWSDAYKLFSGDVAYTWSPPGDHLIQTGLAMQNSGFQIRNQIIWRKPHFAISRGHYTYQHEPCWYGVRKGKKSHWIGDNNASTVWKISLDKNVDGGHSTQKPLECMARPIRNHEGDVYEPFCGSGTTIIACENIGRKCYAVEIDPGYCAVAIHRWKALTGQNPELITA